MRPPNIAWNHTFQYLTLFFFFLPFSPTAEPGPRLPKVETAKNIFPFLQKITDNDMIDILNKLNATFLRGLLIIIRICIIFFQKVFPLHFFVILVFEVPRCSTRFSHPKVTILK